MTDLVLGQEPDEVDGPAEGDRRLWSVTTILNVISKPALLYWAAQKTADAAIGQYPEWSQMPIGDARRWLSDARFRAPEGETPANELGTQMHGLFEQYVLTGVRPECTDEQRPFLDQFDRWCDRFQPAYEATEVVVYHPAYGYAGMLDTIFSVGGFKILADYKTTREPFDSQGRPKRPYLETVLQLAAYRYAELAAVWRPRRYEYYSRRYYLLSPGEEALAVPVPQVDGAGCLLVTPESCELFPMRVDEEAWRAFLFVQEVARWVHNTSRGAIGKPLVEPDMAMIAIENGD